MIRTIVPINDIPESEIIRMIHILNIKYDIFSIGKEICSFHNKYISLPQQDHLCRPCIIKARSAIVQLFKDNNIK